MTFIHVVSGDFALVYKREMGDTFKAYTKNDKIRPAPSAPSSNLPNALAIPHFDRFRSLTHIYNTWYANMLVYQAFSISVKSHQKTAAKH